MEGNRHQQSEHAGGRQVERETQTHCTETRRTRRVYFTISKTAFIFLPTEGQSRTKFFNGVICGLSERPGSEEAERTQRSQRSEATKLSGARMPEQRRAGQLVMNINGDNVSP